MLECLNLHNLHYFSIIIVFNLIHLEKFVYIMCILILQFNLKWIYVHLFSAMSWKKFISQYLQEFVHFCELLV